MTRVVLSLALALAAMLLAIAPASAQTCNAPPGTAAVDQYCENVPSASGNGGRGSGSQGGSGSKPSPATVRQIRQSGRSGKQLATFLGDDEVASARATRERSKRSSDQKKQADKPADATPRQPSSNPLGAVQSAVNSGSTIGDGFVWILLAIAVLIAGIAWFRIRRSSSS
jgi:hypothetical protein